MVFYGSVSDGDDVQETVTGNDTLPNTKCTNIHTPMHRRWCSMAA